jgi:amino acid adenylation domain-containing protein
VAFTIHELLRSSAKNNPESPAVLGPKEALSYAELDAQSDALAQHLVANGVGPGTPVGVAMHKCAASIVGVYGILKAGACYVPIDAFAPAHRSSAIVANTELRYLLTTPDRLATLATELKNSTGGASLQQIFVPTAPKAAVAPPAGTTCTVWEDAAPEVPLPTVTDTHLAYVLHTSGSTGAPKGVAITHRNALCFVESAAHYWGVGSDDRLCSQAPLHFDLSVFDLYVAAYAGASIVLIPEFYAAFPKKMASAIDSQGITIWNSVVSTLTLMMERGKPEAASFDSLRSVIFSGEVMPVRYLRRLHQHMHNAAFYNVYGQTEANSSLVYAVDREAIPKSDDWKVPLGTALPNFDVFVLSADGNEVTTPGERGELLVRAHTVAAGYWGNSALSREKFTTDPRPGQRESLAPVYRTGDIAYVGDDGNFYFGGRTDDMIKSRGYRIELGEIDLALLSCQGVESAVAIALPDEEVGNRILAFATVALDSSLDDNAILAHCRDRLPKYMVPEALYVKADLPRTSTNKIDRNVLRGLAMEMQETKG